MSDPISNMLTSIRNAQAVLHQTVDVPFSVLKYEIAKILQKQGFVRQIEKKGRGIKKIIGITLKYLPYDKSTLLQDGNKIPAISELKRISKPGQRIYISAQKIRKVRDGYGIAIISTSDGLMTNEEARRQKLGGEVICEVW